MYYRIGGHNIKITHTEDESVLDSILTSFIPFKTNDGGKELLFHVTVDNNLKKTPEEDCHLIRDIDTGNGMTKVDRLSNGGYQFLIRDLSGHECGLLISSPDFSDCKCRVRGSEAIKRFALNNAMMLTYAFSAARHDTLLIHASVIRHKGTAYAFTAKSGTGKSTQVANWMRYIPDCDIMNDDNPVIRIVDGEPVLYGSPWSGKTPCYRNIQAPLGAILLIERDDHNHVEGQRPLLAFSTLLSACSSMKWDVDIYGDMCNTINKFIERITVASLHCLPDRESAEVCRAYVTSKE